MALEHILSIVLHSCPGTALVKLIFGREDRGFLLFSPHVPLKVSFSNGCKNELWMVRSWIPTFLIPFSSQRFFAKTCKTHFGWADVGRKEEFTTHTRLVPSILLKFQSFHSSRAYSIVLRSCPGMALVGMIFGW